VHTRACGRMRWRMFLRDAGAFVLALPQSSHPCDCLTAALFCRLRNEKTRLIGLMNNVDISYHFIGKAMLRDSLMTLFFVFVMSVVTQAYAMMVFERPIGPNTNLDLFENSVWLIIITMTTVGYGDLFPQTPMGRYVAIFAALLAVVLVALAVGAVTDRLTLTRDESKVLEFMDNIRTKQDRKAAAAKMLQHSWRAYARVHNEQKQKYARLPTEHGVPENSILQVRPPDSSNPLRMAADS